MNGSSASSQTILSKASNSIPALLMISAFEVVSIQVYSLPSTADYFLIWILSLAVSGLYLGFLSDRYSRKGCLLFTLFAGFSIVLSITYFGVTPWLILLLGLTFNPTPISRASIIDNFPHVSKVQLIVITFIAQFIPWCFFAFLSEIQHAAFTEIVLPCLIVSAILFIFFKDNRDLKTHTLDSRKIIHPGNRTKVYLTFSALLIAQVVFFLSDSFLEFQPAHTKLYSSLGIGSLAGTLLGLLYRKTPHLSVLTLSYGMGFLFSVVPLLSVLFLDLDSLDFSYQTMLVGNLGGFYLPFVYDAILSATSPSYRGTLCGSIELLISIASVISIAFFAASANSNIYLFTFISGLFIISMFLQRISENK